MRSKDRHLESRSRSPVDQNRRPHDPNSTRHRSRSPLQRSHHHHHHHHRHASKPQRPTEQRQPETRDVVLPLNARPISKHDLRTFRPMFALYLDIQKSLYIEDLSEEEVRGRWKSFVGKWNRGELAEGWYDPATLQKAIVAEHDEGARDTNEYSVRDDGRIEDDTRAPAPSSGVAEPTGDNDDDDGDDDFGPSLPTTTVERAQDHRSGLTRPGPTIPTIQDIRAKNEEDHDAMDAARAERIASLRAERKADRHLQKEQLDDLTPRAAAGSRERMLENKRLAAESHRAFAASATATGDVELKDAEVMGDEDSLAELRRMKQQNERKKNERELRREEILRARMAEREQRVRGMREKENKTMDMLRKIAQARFGGGEG